MFNSKIQKSLLFGALAGIIDVIPMLLQNLTWDANLSAFAQWVVAGFLISTSELKLPGYQKGLLISLLLLIPVGILVGWKEPMSLIPMFAMTVILGSALGHLLEK
jgi:hydrogenase/urease accessory protein HupE